MSKVSKNIRLPYTNHMEANVVHQDSRVKLLALFALVGVLNVACGDDDPPAVKNNNTPVNNTTGNNTTGTNNLPGTNNTPGTNNLPGTNNMTNPSGAVSFLQPSADTVYTNGTVYFEVQVEGEPQQIQLMLNETQSLTTFDNDLDYNWSTTTTIEGSHELRLKFEVGGEEKWSSEIKTVVVDRTAPTIASTTPDPTTQIPSDADITVTFSEPVNSLTVNPNTVQLIVANSAITNHTVELSADGLVATIDFDRTSVEAPYDVAVNIDGVADLAGNTMMGDFSFAVPTWLKSTYTGALRDLHFVEAGGNEYIIGRQDASSDLIKVVKNTPNGWTEIVSHDASQIYDMDVKVLGDKVYIAALHRANILGVIQKTARLYVLNATNDAFTPGGAAGVGPDSNDGAVALDIRDFPNYSVGAIATVSQGELKVFSFNDEVLSGATPNVFPSATYGNIGDTSLSVFVRSDALPEVVFSRCENALLPCVRTIIEMMTQTNSGWVENPGVIRTPLTVGVSNTCDEFKNFEVGYLGDTATMLFAYLAPCNNLSPSVYGYRAKADGWDQLLVGTNLMSAIPDPDTHPYTAHLAFGMNDVVHALVASNERLMVAKFGVDLVNWMEPAAADLTTSSITPSLKLVEPRLFMTSDHKPVVLFRQGVTSVYVYRAN